MGNEQIALSFGKGITNFPGDATCDDNSLDESLGMVFDDGEHRPVQKPENIGTIDYKIVYIHKFGDDKIYIGHYTVGNKLRYCSGDITTAANWIDFAGNIGAYSQVSAIGSTLIVKTANGAQYFLWTGSGYKSLGSLIPVLNLRFGVKMGRPVGYENEDEIIYTGNDDGNEWSSQTRTDAIVGAYRRNINVHHRAKRFVNPFAVRYALELYDGTFYHISNPVIIFPASNRHTFSTVSSKNWGQELVVTLGNELYVKNLSSTYFSDFSDIVKRIVVFASKEVDLHDTASRVTHIPFASDCDLIQGYWTDGMLFDYFNKGSNDDYTFHEQLRYSNLTSDDYFYGLLGHLKTFWEWNSSDVIASFVYMDDSLPNRSDNEIINDLSEDGNFYRICSFDVTEFSDWGTLTDKIASGTLENLVEQERIEQDSYYSRVLMKGDCMMTYNSRLVLASVRRGFDYGFDDFCCYGTAPKVHYEAYVSIRTDSGAVVVKNDIYSHNYQGLYFYYPDPRAYQVSIWSGNTLVTSLKLTEHPFLHGAYAMKKLPALPNEPFVEPKDFNESTPPAYVSNTYMEYLPNTIAMSEVNNPWVFHADGYANVGVGNILGLSTVTTALSQGQFGQYPIIVFMSEGIWALSIGNTGTLVSSHPMSREVCNNPASITQTDGAVFFSSDKGLMVIVGSQVKCVSEQLQGKANTFKVGNTEQITGVGNFTDFMKTAIIAYDYRDSLLWLFDGAVHTQGNDSVTGSRFCWIYNIKSGTFGKYNFGKHQEVGTGGLVTVDNIISNVCNDYPDYIIQYKVGNQYNTLSFLQRPNINDDTAVYSGTMITRPMKFSNAMALKSIREFGNVLHFTPYDVTEPYTDPQTNEVTVRTVTRRGTVSLRIFASNDLTVWKELKSLRCMPWKYYRFRFDFADMKATDRFAGTVLVTQERRTNKLR